MSLKIVHCADLHIGASFSHLDTDTAALRSEEIRNSLTTIVKFCKEKNADALLICGDLFDSYSPSQKDSDFVKNALMSLSPIDAYIICGNHDYMCSQSPFSKQDYFSDNVHIFPCFEHSFELTGKNAVLWGKSYCGSTIEPSFSSCSPDSGKINIMCLHGDITPGSDFNIISKETLSSLPCSYAAFGHIHNGEIFSVGNVSCAYSGTPEGHSFNDDGNTGFIYAEISQDGTTVTPVSFSQRKYYSEDIDITEKSESQVIEEAEKLINGTDFFRLTLKGEYSEILNISFIEKELKKQAFYIDITDCSTPGYDLDAIEAEESLRGAFLRELRNLAENEEEYVLAAKAGLDSLCGRVPDMGGAI